MADDQPNPASQESSERSFWALILTQFQGAFSDNAFKTLVTFLVIGEQLASRGKGLVLLIGALFAIPFLVFSMAGGYLADRFSKRSVTIGTKWMEIGVMLLALLGLWLGNLPLQLSAVFLMSVQSALFSPSKYGLLPELLAESRLSWGNGILNLGTFFAIISGIVAGGLLAEQFSARQHWSGFVLIGLALVGLASARLIRKVPAADSGRQFEYNLAREVGGQLRLISRTRLLYLAVMCNGYFFFLAAFLQFNILFYGIEVLHLGETRNSILMAAVAVGIGLGSFLAGILSRGKIEYGLVLLGSVGMTSASGLLALSGLDYLQVAFLLSALGIFGGFFSVPVNALVQHLPARHEKGRVLAASNIVSFVGVALASGVYYVFVVARLHPPQIFLASGVMGVVATVVIVAWLPDSVLRLGLWMMTNSLYRVEVRGRECIPDKGGAVLVTPGISFFQALLLVASIDRTVCFPAHESLFRSRLTGWLLRLMHAVPVSPGEGGIPARLPVLREALGRGQVVCISAAPVGEAGGDGFLNATLAGLLANNGLPIVKVSFGGSGEPLVQLKDRRLRWNLPTSLLRSVTVTAERADAGSTDRPVVYLGMSSEPGPSAG